MDEESLWWDVGKIVSGVFGGLLIAFIAHRLGLGRERQSGIANRRREFLMFLKAWSTAVTRRYLTSGGWDYDPSNFIDQKPEYSALAGAVAGDLSKKDRSTFDVLDEAILARRIEHDQKKALDAIAAMIAFIDSH